MSEAPRIIELDDPHLAVASPASLAWLEQEPTIIRNAGGWVGEEWSLDALRARHDAQPVTVSDTLGADVPRANTLGEFIEYCSTTKDENPLYLHWRFEAEVPDLAEALSPYWWLQSWFDRLPREIDPLLRWWLAGPKGSGTKLHTDIWGTTAWCQLLDGEKYWQFSAPEHQPNEPDRVWHQSPGEIVYTPSLWPHQVRNLSPSYALTGNILNAENYSAVVLAMAHRPRWREILVRLKEFCA